MCFGMLWNISVGKIQIFGEKEHPAGKIKTGNILIFLAGCSLLD